MAVNKFHSAKRKRFINNSIVHVILAILAVCLGLSDSVGDSHELPR